jgi:hypothetical protein
MDFPDEARADAKLKVLIRHLVLSFPHATILSRQVEDRYHVFVIAPYEGGPDKAVQVERAVLVERHTTVDEFRVLLESLHLPTLLQSCERFDIRQSEQACTRPMGSGNQAEIPCLMTPPTEEGSWRRLAVQ